MALGYLSPTAWTGSHVYDTTTTEAVTCEGEHCTWHGDTDVTYPDGATIGTWHCPTCTEANETERDPHDAFLDVDPFD